MMCAGRPRRMLRTVSVQSRRIAIDVRLDGEEISGQAGDGMDQPRSFHGWLGLLGVLDRLLGEPGATTEEPAAPAR